MQSWLTAEDIVANMLGTTTIEECWNTLKNRCLEAIELFIPRIRVRRKQKEWISEEAKKSLRKKDKWFKKWKKTAQQEHRAKYEKAKKENRKITTKLKRKWIEKIFNTKDIHKFWPGVKKLTLYIHYILSL